MNLSEHFTLEEMTRSDTAERQSIANDVFVAEHIDNLKELCEHVLEPLRAYMKKPLHINSGFRCLTLNTAVGGSPNSQHMKGEAADVACKNLKEGRKMLEYIAAELAFDQAFIETNGKCYWLHVSYVRPPSKNRCAVKLLQRKH